MEAPPPPSLQGWIGSDGTVACQAPLSMGFSRQEYWTGLPCPPSGDLPDPGIKPTSLLSLALAGRFFTTVPSRKPQQLEELSLFAWVLKGLFFIFFFSISGIRDGLDRSKVRLPENPGRKFTSQGLGRKKQVPPRRTCSLRVWILKRCWSSWHYVTACAKPVWKGEKSSILVIWGAQLSSVPN